MNKRLSHFVNSILALLILSTCVAWAGDYKIGPGDSLRISVFDHPELSGDLRVSATGNISVPLVGVVAVNDLSPQEVEARLAGSMQQKNLLRNPQVLVTVIEYVSKKITVMGQVARPGQYPLSDQKTLMEALALAGGVVAGQSADELVLTKSNGQRTTIDLRPLQEGDLSKNVTLDPGDTLFIPKAPQFYIYGEVQRPGVYRLERNMTLSQALAAGGGLTAKGTERGMVVKRKDAAGVEHEISAKKAGVLQNDDVINVKERLF